jgi:hypothetical protein
MKVFLSWSGTKSQAVATAFHDWLPYVIQDAKPFISTGDIDKGKRWSEVLAKELSEVAYGIICITQDNFKEPWINFEAGAISKAIDVSYVSPFLFNLKPAQIRGPLQQFQFTIYAKEDIFNLVRSINNRLDPLHQVPYQVLSDGFEVWWPKLKCKLDEIAKIADTETQTGFDWLYTLDDLGRIQATVGCNCIWFITPDPFRNALTPNIKQVIQNNVERGVTYTFIIPSSDEQNEAKQALQHLNDLNPGKIRINDKSSEEDFLKVAVTDYLILNPESGEVEVFVELRTTSGSYWLKVDAKAAMGFVMRFRELATADLAARA